MRLISLCWPESSLLRHPFSLLPVSLILVGAVALPGMVQASAEIPAENSEAPATPEVLADNSEVSVSPEISTKVVLLLGRRVISVIRDGEKLGPWPVAIGDPRTPTPIGVFKVENKVINPQYQSTKSGRVNPAIGVASPLGDRWIGFLQS
ncbi:MAG: L,D-transpeptidase, partial [Cyanobacteriota bacterium]|nr:L,D-transpeptidase [Cyanobacteriota bacterium]